MAGLLKQAAEQVRKAGAKGSPDKILAHITPEEARLLKARGGSGRIDPKTGLPHFELGDDADTGPEAGQDYADGEVGGGASDSGPEDSSWGGGLSGALGMGVSGLNEEDEGKDGSRSGRDDDRGALDSNEYENWGKEEDSNRAAVIGLQVDARDAMEKGGKDAWDAYVSRSPSQDAKDAAAQAAANMNFGPALADSVLTSPGFDLGMGRGYGDTGERNAALAKAGYGFSERAGQYGLINAALNYGVKSNAALDAGRLALSLTNPIASLALSAVDMGGKAALGGDVSLGQVGDVAAGYAGIKGGALLGTAAKSINDTVNKGMDLTQSISQSLYGQLGGMTGGMVGRGIGDALDGDQGRAIGQAVGNVVGAGASQGMAQAASRSEGADQGGAQGNAADSVGAATSLAAQLGLLNGVNPNRSTIKLK